MLLYPGIMGWLFARIALPFPLSATILTVLPVVLGAGLPAAYRLWAVLTYSAGATLGLAAMVGLLLAKESRMRRLTLWAAGAAVLLLAVCYLIAADPFCWRTDACDG